MVSYVCTLPSCLQSAHPWAYALCGVLVGSCIHMHILCMCLPVHCVWYRWATVHILLSVSMLGDLISSVEKLRSRRANEIKFVHARMHAWHGMRASGAPRLSRCRLSTSGSPRYYPPPPPSPSPASLTTHPHPHPHPSPSPRFVQALNQRLTKSLLERVELRASALRPEVSAATPLAPGPWPLCLRPPS